MLTHERLREVLHYEPSTGVFTWRVSRYAARVGTPAGCSYGETGYFRVKVDQRAYLAHRLAWFYVTGEWPEDEVDHIDGDRANNAWENLRAASRQENGRNTRRPANNTSGVKGVSYSKSRREWRAAIRDGARYAYHGWFKTQDDAVSAVLAHRAAAHGEFARHG